MPSMIHLIRYLSDIRQRYMFCGGRSKRPRQQGRNCRWTAPEPWAMYPVVQPCQRGPEASYLSGRCILARVRDHWLTFRARTDLRGARIRYQSSPRDLDRDGEVENGTALSTTPQCSQWSHYEDQKAGWLTASSNSAVCLPTTGDGMSMPPLLSCFRTSTADGRGFLLAGISNHTAGQLHWVGVVSGSPTPRYTPRRLQVYPGRERGSAMARMVKVTRQTGPDQTRPCVCISKDRCVHFRRGLELDGVPCNRPAAIAARPGTDCSTPAASVISPPMGMHVASIRTCRGQGKMLSSVV
ncbi:hypothetical protein LZ30DRAFT_121604 [Colletotrichum cereale]|nr:hypothetical protein LZ30DRAFT_121604 [Colletotrichum cereale]